MAVKPHPTAPDVVALLSRRRVCGGQSSDCVRQDVWVSTDFARTWQSSLQRSAAGGAAIAGFIDFDWAPETQALPAGGGLPSAALLATAYLSAEDQLHGVYWSGYWDKRVHLVVSRDYFTSHLLLRRCGNDFRVMSDGRVFLGVAGNCDGPASAADGWSVTLEVSRNSGGAWSTACFPSFEAEHGYTLYDMGGDVFVNVDHSDTRDPVKAGSPLGVLYHADAEGRLFSLSRRDVLLQPNGVSDFMPAGGLSGVALANSVDGALWTDPAFLIGSKTAYDAVLTAISRDAGSNWLPLPTPAPLAGQAACSSGPCALHVHGPDAAWRANISYPGLYASSGTPGVLWSTGSVGHHLSYEPAEVRTFLSLDGGGSWATVAPNAHTYETAAFGSLLVMAPSGPSGATTEVHYSLDGGLCWGAVQLAQPMQVHNIQTRADNGGQVLLCHGLLPQQGLRLGVYVLDFRSLLARANVATCGASDFEAWAPASCQRGSASILTRRKAHARCLPAPDWAPPPPSSRPCGCSDADYECSYGYERAPGGACVKMPDFSVDPGCPDAAAATTRLIAGDACTGSAPRGGGGGRSRKRGPSGFVVFLIVVIGACPRHAYPRPFARSDRRSAVLACVASAALCVARFLGLPLPPALRDGVDDAVSAVSSGYARLKGFRGGRRLATTPEEDAWLNGPASFAPLAGSYEPPRS